MNEPREFSSNQILDRYVELNNIDWSKAPEERLNTDEGAEDNEMVDDYNFHPNEEL